MGLVVRNGSKDRPQSGLDMRVAVPLMTFLFGVSLSTGTLAFTALGERWMVLEHVRRGDALMKPTERHLDNADEWRHMTKADAQMFYALPWTLEEMRRDIGAIKRKLRIKDEDIRIGADVLPPDVKDDP